VPFDDERALDAVCTVWAKAVYWRAQDLRRRSLALRRRDEMMMP
jgi:hypothetical protein